MNDLQENIYFNRTINTITSVPVSFPLHWHKYVEVIALPADTETEQAPILRIQQTEYRPQPGDLLFIWPGELHELFCNDEKALVGLQFVPTIISDLPELAPFLSLFRTVHHIRQADTPALAESMMLHLRHIFSLQTDVGTFRGVESLICLLELFIAFGEHMEKVFNHKTAQIAPSVYKIAEKMNAACSYIAENCESELNLDAVADHVGFSSCYFSRIFKQITNYSFVEYLTIQRVKRAQTLLADTNVPITEVSYLSGFKSISTFNRVFKQHKGCSPSEYRKYYLV